MGFSGFRHIGLKIFSLALAALLWLVVAGEQIVERALRIPLQFTNLPAQLELVGEPPTVVDVRVRGSSGALSRVAAGELVAVLDLRTARAGQRLFNLTGSDVRAPFGIEVVQLSPSNVSVAFEPSATKTVPVVPRLEGDPADGYVAGIVKSDPATVQVVGPTGAVARLTAAITEPVSIAGATGRVTDMVNIGVADPTVRLVEPGRAEVTVNIVGAPVEWAIAGIPIRRPEHASIELLPVEVTVFVRGPRETRGSRVEDFEATIDIEGLRAGVFQLPVKIVPPARVGVIKVEPPHVRVRIR
jgi:YbbR domain-containing protein